jgi:glucosamine 6-phosphate synthetase-like amidotransferase/phosphosugar isomerase protein
MERPSGRSVRFQDIAMCGIAGYSLDDASRIDRTLAAQALLAAIAERGADATGYAWRGAGTGISVHKQRSGATALLERMDVPAAATQLLVHVRDYTKGHPRIEANNHPIRHGAVVGIHNGIIANDEEIFAAHGFERAQPEMTVDSEAIFALAEEAQGRAQAFEQLRGSMATAWLDERRPEVVFLARAVGRPLWVGRGRHELFFASTRQALRVVEDTLRTSLKLREVDEGRLLGVVEGRVAWDERFKPDRSYVEAPLPAVRAPHEGASSLQRLAAIVAAAA